MPAPDPASLVVPSLADSARWGTGARNWATWLADGKYFRLRGYAWFAEHVGENVSQLARRIPAMEAARKQLVADVPAANPAARPGWDLRPFPWDEEFAVAQIHAGRNREFLRFDKAAKLILLHAISARETGRPAVADPMSAVFVNMRLEPAVFYLLDLNKDFVETVEARRPGFGLKNRIASIAGQPRTVIEGMVRGQTVTYKLAALVRQFLLDEGFDPGAIVVKWVRPKPIIEEVFDGPSDPSADEIRFRLDRGLWPEEIDLQFRRDFGRWPELAERPTEAEFAFWQVNGAWPPEVIERAAA